MNACGFVFWAITYLINPAGDPTTTRSHAIESFDSAKECRAYDSKWLELGKKKDSTFGPGYTEQRFGKCLPAGMQP